MDFLESVNPVASLNAKKMEELIYEDPASAIVKARLFAESILNEVYKQENIEAPYTTTFFEKISYLTREGYIQREIQKSFDTIRLAGNKAAHDGGYNDITEAFRLHREMYNIGVWYYEVYTSEQLQVPLYENPKPPKEAENVEEIVKRKLMELLSTNKFSHLTDSEMKENSIEEKEKLSTYELEKNLEAGESYLLRELGRLKDSSQEAIENANQFSQFKNYLHVERKIQTDLENILNQRKNNGNGNLILLCGSVGDGKSHLLAYIKENKPHLLNEYEIFNDATESFSPGKNAMETLEEVLRSFSDKEVENTNRKVMVAINMGVLHNFINMEHADHSYVSIVNFINESGLYSQNITTHFSNEKFDLLSFGDYHSYEITENGPTSNFYSTLLQKIFSLNEENPFYLALMEDTRNGVNTIVHDNFKLLQNTTVQHNIVQLVVKAIIKNKLVLSARTFLNFIADILIPDNVNSMELVTEFDLLNQSLPNLLFNRKERSSLLSAMRDLDPIHIRSFFIDEIVVGLHTVENWDELIQSHIKDQHAIRWLSPFSSSESLSGFSFQAFYESFLRISYLTNKDFSLKLKDVNYEKYLQNLYSFNVGNMKKVRDIYDEIKSAIFAWKGSPKKDYIYLSKTDEKFRLAQKLNPKPYISHIKKNNVEILDSFKSSILLGYQNEEGTSHVFLDIDFQLYQLINKVREGYRPNKKDKEDAIKFVEFIEKLMEYGEKRNEMLIHYPCDNKSYKIKRDDFEGFVFEREL